MPRVRIEYPDGDALQCVPTIGFSHRFIVASSTVVTEAG